MVKRGKSVVEAEVEREREAAKNYRETLRRRLEGLDVSKNVRRGVVRPAADEDEAAPVDLQRALLSEMAALRLEVRALREVVERAGLVQPR